MNRQRQYFRAHTVTGRAFHAELREYIADYLKAAYRADLRGAGAQWRVFALQVWSCLYPDETVKAVECSDDVRAYLLMLIDRVKKARLITPLRIAQRRRHQARAARRVASNARKDTYPQNFR